MNAINKFIKDEAGVSAIEYAMIAAGIAVAITVAVKALGTSVSAMFTSITAGIK